MKQRRRTTSARRGFTILELIIVVAMMAALAAVSMGRTSKLITSWRITRAAQAIREEMQAGFAIVGRNRKPVIVEFRTDSMNMTIRSRPDLLGNTVIYRRRNLGLSSEYKLTASDLSFSTPTTTLPVAAIEIYPPGLAADSLSVFISRPGVTPRRVRMMRGGLVQLCTSALTSQC